MNTFIKTIIILLVSAVFSSAYASETRLSKFKKAANKFKETVAEVIEEGVQNAHDSKVNPIDRHMIESRKKADMTSTGIPKLVVFRQWDEWNVHYRWKPQTDTSYAASPDYSKCNHISETYKSFLASRKSGVSLNENIKNINEQENYYRNNGYRHYYIEPYSAVSIARLAYSKKGLESIPKVTRDFSDYTRDRGLELQQQCLNTGGLQKGLKRQTKHSPVSEMDNTLE